MRTLTGKLTDVEYFDTSRNGNSRYTARIGCHTVFTGVDSSLGYAIQNYTDKQVSLTVRTLRGKLTIDDTPVVLPAWLDKPASDYRRGELSEVRKGADKHFMPSIVIRSDSGQTKHLAISWEEFERVVALLTEG